MPRPLHVGDHDRPSRYSSRFKPLSRNQPVPLKKTPTNWLIKAVRIAVMSEASWVKNSEEVKKPLISNISVSIPKKPPVKQPNRHIAQTH